MLPCVPEALDPPDPLPAAPDPVAPDPVAPDPVVPELRPVTRAPVAPEPEPLPDPPPLEPEPRPAPACPCGAASWRAESSGIEYMTPAGLLAFGSVGCVDGVRAAADAVQSSDRLTLRTEPMSTMRRTTQAPIIDLSDPVENPDPRPDSPAPEGSPAGSRATLAVAFVLVLLLLATTSQGAFAVSRWAPLTLLIVAVLIGALLARGGLAVRSRSALVAIASIWLLAIWSFASMTWAQSSSDAFAAGDRLILYAAIATLPFALPLSRRTLVAAGWALTVGVGVIAVYALLRLLIDGPSLYLAGRLNGPIGYRNATALLFALAVWPGVIAAASKEYRRWVRAGGLSLAMLCLGLAFLTQSRGIVLGLAVGALPVFALGPDRVRRAWIAILAVAGVALASPWLLRPFHAFDGGDGFVTPHSITVAAWGLGMITVAGFGVGMLIALFDNGLRAGSGAMRDAQRAARIGLAVTGAMAVIAAAIAIGNPVTYASQKWDQFSSLQSSTPTTTRLGTVGGQRYDLWRVAMKEFESAPLLGVGADNYPFGYYRDRATNRNLEDPHSLLFALLSEEGVVGIVLFVLFVGGIFGAMGAGWKALPPQSRRHAVAPAAAGAVMLGQSTVDWIWLIPGLTAIGLLSLAIAAAQVSAGAARAPNRASSRAGGLTRLGAVAGLLVATAAVLALFISDAYIQRARSVVADPPAELSAAKTAAWIDPWSVTPHYLQASAYETMGDLKSAYGQLQDALSLEPQNSASLGVLGDFEVRRGNLGLARSYYRRALALNPLDTGLQQLARIGERAPRGR